MMGCANIKFFPREESPKTLDGSTQVYDGDLVYFKNLASQQSAEIFRLESDLCTLKTELDYFKVKYFREEYSDFLETKRPPRMASSLV